MRTWISALLMVVGVGAVPAHADYMATGFSTNAVAAFAEGKFLGVGVTPGALVASTLPLPDRSIPFSVSGNLVVKSVDCISVPSAWTEGDDLDLEVYTHTDATGDAGTATGMTLTVSADVSEAVELFHSSVSPVTVSESSGAISIKVVDDAGYTAGTVQLQCSVRYE